MLQTLPESLVYDQKLQGTDLAYLFLSAKALGRWRGLYGFAVSSVEARHAERSGRLVDTYQQPEAVPSHSQTTTTTKPGRLSKSP